MPVSLSPERCRALRAHRPAAWADDVARAGAARPAPPTCGCSTTTTSSRCCSAAGAPPGAAVTFANPAGLWLLAAGHPGAGCCTSCGRGASSVEVSLDVPVARGRPPGVGGPAVAAPPPLAAAAAAAPRRRLLALARRPTRCASPTRRSPTTPSSSSTPRARWPPATAIPTGSTRRRTRRRGSARAARRRRRQRRGGRRRPRVAAHRQRRPRRVRPVRSARWSHGGRRRLRRRVRAGREPRDAGRLDRVRVLSDGGLTDAEQALLPPGTDLRPIGDRVDEPGHLPPVVEPRGSACTGFVTVQQHRWAGGDADVRLDVDGAPPATARSRSGPGETVDVEVDLPGRRAGAGVPRGRGPARRRRPRLRGRRPAGAICGVLVAGPSDPFLDALLAAIPGVEVDRSTTPVPAPRRRPRRSTTGSTCRPTPGRRSWPSPRPAVAPGVAVTGSVEQPAVDLVRADDPLLADVDLSGVGHRRRRSGSRRRRPRRWWRPRAPRCSCGAPPAACRSSTWLRAGRVEPAAAVRLPHARRPHRDRAGGGRAAAAVAAPPATALPVDAARDSTVTGPGGLTIDVPGRGGAARRPGGLLDRRRRRRGPSGSMAVNPAASESDLDARPRACWSRSRTRPRATRRHAASEASWRGWPCRCWPCWRPSGPGPAPVGRVAAASCGWRPRCGSPWPWRWSPPCSTWRVVRPGRGWPVMFLVDGSGSLGSPGRAEALDWARDALDDMPDGARPAWCCSAGTPGSRRSSRATRGSVSRRCRSTPSRTDLAGALRLAAAVLPSDARRRVVLVSDGRADERRRGGRGRAAASTWASRSTSTRWRGRGSRRAVAEVDAPGAARQGEAVRSRPPSRRPRRAGARHAPRRQRRRAGAGGRPGRRPQRGGVRGGRRRAGLARYQVRVTTSSRQRRRQRRGLRGRAGRGPAAGAVVEGRPAAGAAAAAALRPAAIDGRRRRAHGSARRSTSSPATRRSCWWT